MEEPFRPPPLPSYWQGILDGGPVIMTLHLCMLVCFTLSILMSVRQAGTFTAFTLSVAPFFFGAVAMWLGTVGLLFVMTHSLEARDWPPIIRVLQRPFYLGGGLSTVALISHFFTRAFYSKSRNA